MSLLLCSVCDRQFDTNEQVEAEYTPPVCEGCLNEAQEQLQQTWNQLDQDTQAIEEFCNVITKQR